MTTGVVAIYKRQKRHFTLSACVNCATDYIYYRFDRKKCENKIKFK